MYEMMIWAGTGLTLLGLAGLVWCIIRANKVRRAKPSEEELRDALGALLPVNLAAMFLSAIGLMLVVIGIILG